MKSCDSTGTASTRFPVYEITHIHTEYSNGSSSELDPMIRRRVRDALGPDAILKWGECFTTVDKLLYLLRNPRQKAPIGVIAVTGHMNHRNHFFSDDMLRAAAIDPRLGVCSEVSCIDQDVDGKYRVALEVLVYGDEKGLLEFLYVNP